MIPISIDDMKTYCIDQIKRIEKQGPLFRVYYTLLKENGISYVRQRTAFFDQRDRQLKLFKTEDVAHGPAPDPRIYPQRA